MTDPQIPQRAIEFLSRGRAYKQAGDFERAVPMYEQALEEVRRAIGEADVQFGHSLGNLGLLFTEMGKYERAEPLLQRAVEVVRRAPAASTSDRAAVINNLAGLYQQTGQEAKAEPLFAEALELERATGGEETPEFARVLNNLALSLLNLGRYEKAEPLASRALDLRRQTLPAQHPDIAQSLNNLGLLYERTGRYAKADALYRESVTVAEWSLGAAHPQLAIALGNLARLQQQMGRVVEAEELFKRALGACLQSLGQVHPTTAILLGNLGMLYHDAGHFAEAKALFEGELEISEELRDVNGERFASALNHLGLVHLRLGEYEEAAALLSRALEVSRADPLADRLLVATILNNMALVHIDTGRYAEAEPLLREVQEIRLGMQGERHPDYEQCLYNLAIALVPLGHVDEARDLLHRAAAVDDELIGQVFGISADSERLALLGMLRERFELYLSLVLRHRASDPAAVRAAFDFVLRRKGVGTEVAAVQRTALLAGRYPELDEQVAELARLAAEITRGMMAGPGPEGPAVHARRLAERTARQARLEAELAGRIVELRPSVLMRKANHRTVAAALPADAALVELVRILPVHFEAVPARGDPRRGPARYIAFVLHADRPDDVRLVDLGEADQIDRYIASARIAIMGERSGEEAREDDASMQIALRRAVFDPLNRVLDGRRRIILSPDGDLTTWPFEVLPLDDGRPLVEEYTFSYLSVARDILRFGGTPGRTASAPLVVADPDYSLASTSIHGTRGGTTAAERRSRQVDRSGIHFDPLPATRAEGERIAQLLGTSAILGGAAREGLVKCHRAPRLLHIATHGFFMENDDAASGEKGAGQGATGGVGSQPARDLSTLENPLLRSGLALAGANTWLNGGLLPDDAEDGLLTAEDVSGLDLLGTELVVLSACETGLGQVHTGEGVFGLRRAFMLAGAQALVMSLWEIPDEETEELMRGFYERVLAGVPRALALREAQLALRERRPDPFYWGAFICQGDPGPLRS